MCTKVTTGKVLSSGMLRTVTSFGDGEGTGLSVWHCHKPAVPSGAGHGPSLDFGTGAVIPEFFKILSPIKDLTGAP